MAVMRSGWDGMERGKKREPGGLEGGGCECVCHWVGSMAGRQNGRAPGADSAREPMYLVPRTYRANGLEARACDRHCAMAGDWLAAHCHSGQLIRHRRARQGRERRKRTVYGVWALPGASTGGRLGWGRTDADSRLPDLQS